MLDTKEKLRLCLKKEKNYYISGKNIHDRLLMWCTKDPAIQIWKYQKALRYAEYYSAQKGLKKWICYTLVRRKKNRLGMRLGIEISEKSFETGLIIYHGGNIVVNGYARIGKNCRLHGDNCIGNNGHSEKAPCLGDGVDIGVGAKIIGDVKLADNITIGAGAVVTRSFLTPGIVIAGIPAKEIH